MLGRKVFVCALKPCTRAQTNQHIRKGDSLVDGTESEDGGFMGYPVCEFCRNSFYGDNELYMHVVYGALYLPHLPEAYPRQFGYFKNYDDLRASGFFNIFFHFRSSGFYLTLKCLLFVVHHINLAHMALNFDCNVSIKSTFYVRTRPVFPRSLWFSNLNMK